MGKKMIYFLLLLAMTVCIEAEFQCSVATRSVADLGLNERARDGLRELDANNRRPNSLNSLVCRCSTNSETLNAQMDNNLDDDNDVASDWREARVLVIRDCDELVITGTGNDLIDGEMNGAVFILDNIRDLRIQGFPFGWRTQTGSNVVGDLAEIFRSRFSSVYIRNSVIGQFSLGVLQVEDKFEFLMHNVSAAEDVSVSIEVQNFERVVRSLFTLEDSNLGPMAFATSNNIDSNSAFKLEAKTVSNSDSDECYTNDVIRIVNNTFGTLGSNSFSVQGAKDFVFESNEVGVANDDALEIVNTKSFSIKDNTFDALASTPLVRLSYTDLKSGCSVGSIKGGFTDNRVPFVSRFLIGMDASNDFSDSDLSDLAKRFNVSHNGAHTQCQCEDIVAENSDSAISDEERQVWNRLVRDSMCEYRGGAEPVMGARRSICVGDYPESLAEMVQRIRDEEGGAKLLLVLLAIGITAVITAVVTAGIVFLCCVHNNGEVIPN